MTRSVTGAACELSLAAAHAHLMAQHVEAAAIACPDGHALRAALASVAAICGTLGDQIVTTFGMVRDVATHNGEDVDAIVERFLARQEDTWPK